jgi:hypothetical protein
MSTVVHRTVLHVAGHSATDYNNHDHHDHYGVQPVQL